MTRKRLAVITLGVMLSLFMASVEGSIVATAMPTIVSSLGGLAIYSWVFSAYMLAATTSVPIYGKLSDLFGRRPVYVACMGLFLLGSVLCGRATDMTGLIAARVVQGLGAGGLLPLAFTIIGDLFNLEQRARMQGVFSGVWGVSSIIGPLIGGFLVDRVSWRWVFYFNIAPGLLALALVWLAWRDPERRSTARVSIDFAGVGVLSAAVVALLLGLFELPSPASVALLTLAAALFYLLWRIERRAADPLLPLPLFRNRLFTVACLHGVLAGCATFGAINYIPLFVQAVLGGSATLAGSALAPQSLAWVLMSLVGSRLLLHTGYRNVVLGGMILLATGAVLTLLEIGIGGSVYALMATLAVMGAGMGLSYPAFLIAVQTDVPRRHMGSATSTLQFSRSIGGTLGVSVMGAALSLQLSTNLVRAGLDPAAMSLNELMAPVANQAAAALDSALRVALNGAIQTTFVIALAFAALGLAVSTLAPRGRASSGAVEEPAA